MEVGLSLGSNVGDRLAMLRGAGQRIAALAGVRILAGSPVYETEPVGVKPAYVDLRYLNAVLVIEYDGDPAALANELHAIEASLGRKREPDRNAPRTIDIDVLYAGEVRQSDGTLDLPHPRWSERRFVVQPLADVRPSLKLPGSARTVAEVLAALPDNPRVVRFADAWL